MKPKNLYDKLIGERHSEKEQNIKIPKYKNMQYALPIALIALMCIITLVIGMFIIDNKETEISKIQPNEIKGDVTKTANVGGNITANFYSDGAAVIFSGNGTIDKSRLINFFNTCGKQNICSITLENYNQQIYLPRDSSELFSGLTELQFFLLSDYKTSNVTSMSGMFKGCTNLEQVNIDGCDLSSVVLMTSMFEGCTSLTLFYANDTSTINFSSVTSMAFMFKDCISMTDFFAPNVLTSSLKMTSGMFQGCSSLYSVDLVGWDNSKVTDTTNMYTGCESLTQIYTEAKYSSTVTNLPGTWFNLDNISDNTIYTSYSRANFSESVHLGKLKDYTITYNLDGGTVSGNPTSYNPLNTSNFTLNNPTKTGYSFTGWTGSNGNDKQLSVTITPRTEIGDRSYKANWERALDTTYTVNHYQQNVDGSTNYTKVETETPTVQIGASVTPGVKTYEGFNSPAAQTKIVEANGQTVIDYYYTRKSFNVTLNRGTGINQVTGGGQKLYGSSVTVSATLLQNTDQYTYGWGNWAGQGIAGSQNQTYTFTMPASNVTLTANGTQSIKSYLQTVQVRYENGDGSFTGYTNEINRNYNYGETVSWSKAATDTHQAANIQSYTVTGAKTTQVTVYRNTRTVTLNRGTGIEGVNGEGTFKVGQTVTVTATPSQGYIWSKWTGTTETTTQNYSFTMPTTNVNLTANAVPSTTTPYLVNHWKQNINGIPTSENESNYTIAETENKTGTTNTQVTPGVKSYQGFNSPATKTETILGNGRLVVNYYYTRNATYTVNHWKQNLGGIANSEDSNNYTKVETETLTGITKANTTPRVKTYAGFTAPSVKTVQIAGEGTTVVDYYYTRNTTTPYTVNHWQQNVNGISTSHDANNYTIKETEHLTGTTGASVTPRTKNYKGMVIPQTQTVTINEQGTTVVDYYYELIEPKVESSIDKDVSTGKQDEDGNWLITKEDDPINYTIRYNTKINDYEGKATIEIQAKLPAGINLTKSNIGDGVYNNENKTITWREDINDINTHINGEYTKTTTKQITVVYIGQNVLGNLDIQVTGRTITYYPDDYQNQGGTSSKDEIIGDGQGEGGSGNTGITGDTTIKQEYKSNFKIVNVWDDNDNIRNERPEDVTITVTVLPANKTITKVLNEANNWTYEETGLAKYDKKTGEKVRYIVTQRETEEGDLQYYNQAEITEEETQDENVTNYNITITNTYRLIDTELNSELTVTGTQEITSTQQEIDYTINFKAEIEDYIGNGKLTIVNKLPHKINELRSEIGTGIYNEARQTITYTYDIRDIDTRTSGQNYMIDKTENLKVVYSDINTELLELRNKVQGKKELIETKQGQTKTANFDTKLNIGGRVIVHHYIYDEEDNKYTTQRIVPDDVILGKAGDIYTTNPTNQIPENYKYTEKEPVNRNGVMQERGIEVNYYYQLKEAKVESNIDKDVSTGEKDEEGNWIITKEDAPINYTINYTTKINDYKGKATIEIQAKLPAGIDITKSNIANGNYNEANKTITWTEDINDINTYKNGEYTKTTIKEITLVYDGQNMAGNLDIQVTGKTKTYYPDDYPDKGGTSSKDEIIGDGQGEGGSGNTGITGDTTIKQEYKSNIKVVKLWNDNDNIRGERPESVIVTIKVMPNNKTITKELSEENNWTYEETGLPKYDKTTGEKINYTVIQQEKEEGELQYYNPVQIAQTEEQNGNITIYNITLTNTYRLIDTDLKAKISILGPEKITNENQKMEYTINLKAEIADYVGNGKIKIVSRLPFGINQAQSSIGNGVYNPSRKTITYTYDLQDIDTRRDGRNYPIDITEKIEIMYADIDIAQEKMTNKVNGIIELIETGKGDASVASSQTEIEIGGKIVVHHYIYDEKSNQYTTVKLAEDDEIKGQIGTQYTTRKSDKVPKNYRVVNERPENYEGRIEKGIKEVNYYYQLKAPIVGTDTGSTIISGGNKDENGNWIVKKGEEIKYRVEYDVKIDDYIGTAVIETIVKLPAGIDPDKSDLAGGIYDRETNTITWTEEVKDIDTFTNGEYTEHKIKDLTIVYDNDYVLKDIELEVITNVITYYPEDYPNKGGEILDSNTGGKVVVHHYIYDEKSNQYTTAKVAEDEEIKGEIGQEYTTNKSNQVPQNFKVVNEKPENYTGKIEKGIKEVSYYYQLKTPIVETDTESTIVSGGNKDENGNWVVKKDEEVKYRVEYDVKVDDYIGTVVIETTVKLPAGIDPDKSDLAGGIYDKETNTITWRDEVKDIDTFTNGAYTDHKIKDLTLVFDNDYVLKDLNLEVTTNVLTFYPDNYPNKGGEILDSKTEETEQNFNMSVEKTIVSINQNGSEVKISDNQLAKIELKSADVKNTEIYVRYNIKVANTGEIAGTATVKEDIPQGFKIGEKPNYWETKADGTLETEVQLEAGQSKDLGITLKWENSDNNLGAKENIAQIVQTSIEEKDTKDNTSTATVIISIKTGEAVSIIIIIMLVISYIIAGYMIYISIRRMGKEPDLRKIKFLMK